MSLHDRALRYFLAVARSGSFTRAAEECAVVQSAVSHQIRVIEQEFGVSLFVRDGRRATLTPAGEMLFDYAQSVISLVDRASLDLRRFAQGDVGRLRIGFQSAAARQPVVAEALQRLRERYPQVALELSAGMGGAMIEAIAERRLDGAFMYADADVSLDRQIVCTDDWVLALPASHRLASRGSLRLQDLTDEPFIWLPRDVNPRLHDRMLAACASRHFTPRIAQEAFDEPMVLNLVAVGLGVAFVLDSLPPSANANIVLRRVADFSVPIDLCFLGSEDCPNRLLTVLRSLVSEVVTAKSGSANQI